MTSILFIPFFSLCEACQHYCFQLIYMLVAEMIFCKTVSNIRNTGRLRNMYSEMQRQSCGKKSLSESCYGLHYFLIVSLEIRILNCKLFAFLSFQIDFLSEVTFTSPGRKCILSLTRVIIAQYYFLATLALHTKFTCIDQP